MFGRWLSFNNYFGSCILKIWGIILLANHLHNLMGLYFCRVILWKIRTISWICISFISVWVDFYFSFFKFWAIYVSSISPALYQNPNFLPLAFFFFSWLFRILFLCVSMADSSYPCIFISEEETLVRLVFHLPPQHLLLIHSLVLQLCLYDG